MLAYTVEGVPYIRKLYGFFKKTVNTVCTVALMLAGVHLKYRDQTHVVPPLISSLCFGIDPLTIPEQKWLRPGPSTPTLG